MELIPPTFSTAESDDGVFVGSRSGISLISGPPLSVVRFGLERDHPCWRPIDPRRIRWDVRRARAETARARLLHRRPYPDAAREDRNTVRRTRHLQRVRAIIGNDLFRLSSRLPSAARPFSLVWLAHRSLGFNDLLMDAPMIAVALALSDPSTDRPLSLDDWRIAIDEESLAKRRDILVGRGLPGSAVGGLQRVTAQAADPRFLPQLAATLQDASVVKLFNHSRAIGPDLLRIFSDERLLSRVSSRFIRLVSESDRRRREAYFAPMIEAVLVVLELGESRGGKRVTFASPEKLEEWYHRTAHHVAPEDVERIRHCRFKPAPVNGISGYIEQIQTGEDLLAQAISMQQCCAGEDYVHAMRDGYTFLFRAGGFGLPACTIEITAVGEDDDGARQYAITQVAGKCNETLSAQALSAIRVWAEDEGIEMFVGPDRNPLDEEGQLIVGGERNRNIPF